MKQRRVIPFDFVLEALDGLPITTKQMFGCHTIYVGEKMVLLLRQREKPVADDGIWVATIPEHHESLRAEFPSLRSITIFGPGETGTQNLPCDDENFEKHALRICELIQQGDERVGRIPKGRKTGAANARKKKAVTKKATTKKRVKKASAKTKRRK